MDVQDKVMAVHVYSPCLHCYQSAKKVVERLVNGVIRAALAGIGQEQIFELIGEDSR